MFRYSLFATPLGHMGVVASPQGLHMVILPRPTEKAVKGELERHYTEELVRDETALAGIRKKLVSYLSGEKVVFNLKLDAVGATPFEIKVWDAVNGIPYGQTRSYDWIAKQVGAPRKVRAVGQALKHNRLPLIIPCHRVISKSGDLGGFSAGVELKRELLKLEGRLL